MTKSRNVPNNQLAQDKFPYSEIRALNEMAWGLRSTQPEQGRKLAQQALELSRSKGSLDITLQEARATSLVILGFINKDEGKLETAFSQIHEALALLTNSPPSKTASDARYVIAWAYIHLGDYARALEYATQARTLARGLGLRNEEALALNTEAYVYYLTDDVTESLKNFDTALQIVKETGDLYSQCFILNNMTLALMAAGKHENALVCGAESLKLAREQSLFDQELNIIDTIAQVLLDMRNYLEAERYLKQALSKIEKQDPDVLQVYLLSNLGKTYFGQREFEQAETVFLRALSAASKVEARAEQATCHKLLYEVYESQGRLEEALDHFKQFHAMNEAVMGEKASMRLSTLKVAHQLETAQRDAEIYRLQTIELQHEIENRKQTEALLNKLATTDSLTNLYNRHHLIELAEREFERAQRHHRPLATILLDVDHFKQVNDIHGHATGDQVLKIVAKRCYKTIRGIDILGRYGGEEFIVILPETDLDSACIVAERLRTAINSKPIHTVEGLELKVTASLGVAQKDEHTTSLEVLIRRADQAMYIAKHKGRNCIATSM